MTDRDEIRAFATAWNEHGAAAIERFLAEDVEWHDAPEVPDGGVHRGRAEVIKLLHDWESGSGAVGVSGTVEEILGEDGDYFTANRMRVTGGASGVSVPELYWYFATRMRDGKISEVRVFLSRDQALAAAGLTD